MEKVYTFNKSVRGHLHVMRDIPCEDYSCSFSDKNGRYHIAAVADGHGADSCFRSAKGSKFACEAALNCLKQFADSILSSDESEKTLYYEAFSDRTSLDVTLRRLTDLISAKWYDEVMADYEKNPPTSEAIGDYSEMYKDGSKTTHIYGTTLIAALLLPSHLLLFQQGDGRCEVFFDDGTIEQPIPWDNRCQDTATTSLCDDDVLESFRSAVINLNKKKVIACYLGSDGVEDAYRDTYEDLGGMHCVMGGVHAFYKNLTCKIMDTTIEDFEDDLGDFLEFFSEYGLFSKSGSGDDVSVAGIVDLSAVAEFTDNFEFDTKLYNIEEQLSIKENELLSKQRKHKILRKRMNEAKEDFDKAKRDLEFLESRKSKLDAEKKIKSNEYETIDTCIDEFRRYLLDSVTSEENESKLQQFVKKITETTFNGKLLNLFNIGLDYEDKKNPYLKKLEEMSADIYYQFMELKEKYQKISHNYSQKKEDLETLEEKYRNAKKEFSEYDSKYQSIEADISKLKKEFETLQYGIQPHSETHTDNIPNESENVTEKELSAENEVSIEPKLSEEVSIKDTEEKTVDCVECKVLENNTDNDNKTAATEEFDNETDNVTEKELSEENAVSTEPMPAVEVSIEDTEEKTVDCVEYKVLEDNTDNDHKTVVNEKSDSETDTDNIPNDSENVAEKYSPEETVDTSISLINSED